MAPLEAQLLRDAWEVLGCVVRLPRAGEEVEVVAGAAAKIAHRRAACWPGAWRQQIAGATVKRRRFFPGRATGVAPYLLSEPSLSGSDDNT